MKKLFTLAIALLCATTTFSQSTTMTSVLGIELGSSKETVKSTLASKQPESKVYSETNVSVSFENVKFGAYSPMLVIFQFDENKLHTVKIFIEPEFCKDVYYTYDKVVETINERYFKGKPAEGYRYPYTKADKYKYTETIVRKGYGTHLTVWNFDNLNTPSNGEDDNVIVAKITTECVVNITYQDGVLINNAIQKQKAKQSNDY